MVYKVKAFPPVLKPDLVLLLVCKVNTRKYELSRNRQELVEHYESLMKDAKLREQRAEWRTRRLELSDARQQLWLAEREQLRQEMDKSPLLLKQHSPSHGVVEEHMVKIDATPTVHPSIDHMITESPPHEEGKIVEQSEQSSAVPDEPHPLEKPQLMEPLNSIVGSITVGNETKCTAELNVSMETTNTYKSHISDSVVHQVLNPTSDVIAEEFSQYLSPRQQLRHGRAPVSTIQDIMYPSKSPAPVYYSTRGKPPPTTIQNLLHHHYYHQSGKYTVTGLY